MPLQFYGEGKTGEVWVEDQRPDGSVVMLICSEAAVGPSTEPAQQKPCPDESIGLVYASATDGGAYPLPRETGKVSRRLPKLHLDTTNMPGGFNRFRLALFGRKAMDTAEQGIRDVQLTTATAAEWGWLPEAPQRTNGARSRESMSITLSSCISIK